MDHQKNVLFGLYDDEQILLSAVKKAKDAHLDIMDVLTPFPVHGLDPILGLKESRLHIVGFIFGALGASLGFGLMTWIFTRDWPTIFGGKPYWSVPAFIPIAFEITVLLASIGMVVTYFTVNGLAPGVKNPILHDRITDDKFCIAFNTNGYSDDKIQQLQSFFEDTGASFVDSKEI